jgi:transcriptional regulator with XRE-family HTH domain
LAEALGLPLPTVAGWFGDMPFLKGDGVGVMPRLGSLLHARGVTIEEAARACQVSADQMRAWVSQRRTVQRSAVESLAKLLGMDVREFISVARYGREPLERVESALRDARQRQGMTQRELGARVGVAGETVSHWECGSWVPPAHQVFRLARALRLDPWVLAEGLGVEMPDRDACLRALDSADARDITWARMCAGLTRAQLARCLGVRSATVGRWEAGGSSPRGVYRRRLEEVLGVEALAIDRGPAQRGSSKT